MIGRGRGGKERVKAQPVGPKQGVATETETRVARRVKTVNLKDSILFSNEINNRFNS